LNVTKETNKIVPRPIDKKEKEIIEWMEDKAECMVKAGHGVSDIDVAFYTAGHFDLCPGSPEFQTVLKAATNILFL
jgi:hypothetical protein